MTSDEQELFLSLKYRTITDAIEAFKTAAHVTSWADTSAADKKKFMIVFDYWLEQGAPNEPMKIPDELATALLELKFGDVDKAWDYVMSRPHGEHHGLTDSELKVVMDYVKPPKD